MSFVYILFGCRMNYLAWKMFIDVSELGSLSKAAALWETSQPQISRHIKGLEEEFGCQLFTRTGRGVELSELGRRIEPEVRGWLQHTEQLGNDIKTASGVPIGKVKLAIIPSTATPWLGEVVTLLRERYPLVSLEVKEGQGNQLETWLDEGRVDLAVHFRHAPEPDRGDVYLRDTQTYLVGPPNSPFEGREQVEFSELDGLPFVLFCRPSSWRDRLDHLARRYEVNLGVSLEADSLALQAHAVAHNGCYALLGAYASAAAKKSLGVSVSRVVGPSIRRYLALSMSPHGQMTLAAKKVKELIQEVAERYPPGFDL